jgi:hypothetical protein
VRALRQREDGIALPVAIALLAVVMVLAGVALAGALSTTAHARRDARSKPALQAADAGIQSALYRLNRLREATSTSGVLCVVDDATERLLKILDAAGSQPGWCPPSDTEQIGNGEAFSYAETPLISGGASDGLHVTLDRRIVATGTVCPAATALCTARAPGAINRRVLADVNALDLGRLPSDDAILSDQTLTLNGNAQVGTPKVNGNVRSNQGIELGDNTRVCGNATPGPGSAVTTDGNAMVCQSEAPAPSALALPTVTAPAEDDDAALLNLIESLLGKLFGGLFNTSFDAQTTVLHVGGNDKLELPAGTYHLCKLTVDGNATLDIGTGPVIVYMKPPEDCGGVSGTSTPVNVSGNFHFTGDPAQFQLLVAGSDTVDTAVKLGANLNSGPVSMFVVAPRSTVTLSGNSQIKGTVVGAKVALRANAKVTQDGSAGRIVGQALTLYHRGPEMECAATLPGTSEAPDRGC